MSGDDPRAAGSNGVGIEVSRHHAVSVSNFQCIGRDGSFSTLFPASGANSFIEFSV